MRHMFGHEGILGYPKRAHQLSYDSYASAPHMGLTQDKSPMSSEDGLMPHMVHPSRGELGMAGLGDAERDVGVIVKRSELTVEMAPHPNCRTVEGHSLTLPQFLRNDALERNEA